MVRVALERTVLSTCYKLAMSAVRWNLLIGGLGLELLVKAAFSAGREQKSKPRVPTRCYRLKLPPLLCSRRLLVTHANACYVCHPRHERAGQAAPAQLAPKAGEAIDTHTHTRRPTRKTTESVQYRGFVRAFKWP